MAFGSVRQIVVCVPAHPLTYTNECGQAKAIGSMEAYVIDASQAANLETLNAPFDYVLAGQLWGLAFTFVVGLYLLSKASGVILNRIKA